MKIVLETTIEGYPSIMTEDKDEGLFIMSCLERGGAIITGKTKEECLETFKEAMKLSIFAGRLNKIWREKIERIIDEVLEMYPDKVNNYKLGKTGVIGLFAGEAMKRTKGKADPKELLELIKLKLDKI